MKKPKDYLKQLEITRANYSFQHPDRTWEEQLILQILDDNIKALKTLRSA